jgi:hypothetical protein
MIIDFDYEKYKPRRGVIGYQKSMSSLRDLSNLHPNFYNHIIPYNPAPCAVLGAGMIIKNTPPKMAA